MSKQNKPEVHLEVCRGFFRIPTDKVIYNITVLEKQECSEAKSLNGIVSAEEYEFQPKRQTKPLDVEGVGQDITHGDTFYKDAAIFYCGEFNRLIGGQTVSSQGSLQIGPAPSKHVEEKLAQARALTEDAQQKLKDIQAWAAIARQEEQDIPAQGSAEENDVRAKVETLKNIIAELLKKTPAVSPEAVDRPQPPKEQTTRTRYLFDMDTVFQTIYELCTNETVKEHSQNVRAQAKEIFDRELFLDYVSERVKSYSEDDGFLSVPLADILVGLIKGCSDKKTVNLLKNMNKQQADIFLDQFLPLEVPPTEEIEIEGGGSLEEELGEQSKLPGDSVAQGSPAEAIELLDSIEAAVVSFGAQRMEASPDAAIGGLKDDCKTKLAESINILGEVGKAITQIGDELGKASSDPISDGKSAEVMHKMINTANSMAISLANKENNPELSFSPNESAEDSQLNALEGDDDFVRDIVAESEEESDDDKQAEIDEILSETFAESSLTDENTGDFGEGAASPPGEESVMHDGEANDDFSEASQDDIDKLLEEMGA
jgi:hypothetical protein